MPFGIGHWELIALAVVLVLLFGGSRIPEIGRRLGRTARETRKTIAEIDPRSAVRELGESSQRVGDKSQPQRKDEPPRDMSER